MENAFEGFRKVHNEDVCLLAMNSISVSHKIYLFETHAVVGTILTHAVVGTIFCPSLHVP